MNRMIEIVNPITDADFVDNMVPVKIWRPKGVEMYLDLEKKQNEKGAYTGPYFEMSKNDSREFNKKLMAIVVDKFSVDEIRTVKPRYVEETKICKPTTKS